jgi:hypothetical protein
MNFVATKTVQSSMGQIPRRSAAKTKKPAIQIFRFGSRSNSIPRPLAAGFLIQKADSSH